MLLQNNAALSVTLGVLEYELYTITPVKVREPLSIFLKISIEK